MPQSGSAHDSPFGAAAVPAAAAPEAEEAPALASPASRIVPPELPAGDWPTSDAAACPSGWTRLRVPVALPSWSPSGEAGGELGAAAAALAERGVPVVYAPEPEGDGVPEGWAVAKGTYEGGLVQWECASDAAAVLLGAARLDAPPPAGTEGQHDACMRALASAVRSGACSVVEVGCGTALPSAALASARTTAGRPTSLLAQDLNAPALTLKAAPTLSAALRPAGSAAGSHGAAAGTAAAAAEAPLLLSGAWGEGMDEALATGVPFSGHGVVIVASETVYRAEGLRAHTATLLGLLARARRDGASAEACVVAAKRFYFGRGLEGGTAAFAEAAAAWGREHGVGVALWRAAAIEDGKSNVRDVIVACLV